MLPEQRLLGTLVQLLERRSGGGGLAPDALLEFCRRRSQPAWIEGRHLTLIAAVMQEVIVSAAEGRGIRVILQAPPRHGKTHLVGVNGPVWGLGQFPFLQFAYVSYALPIALDKSYEARSLMERIGRDEWGLTIDKASSAKSDWRLANLRGRMLATSFKGGLMGHGVNVALIDDPYKDEVEAFSPDKREEVDNWWKSNLTTRLEPGASVLLQHTRWHEDDQTGRLLDREGRIEDGGLWRVIDLQAICEVVKACPLGRGEGEPLWPERWPLEELERKRREVGPYRFAALYQQRPQPATGGLFKRTWFCYAERETRTLRTAQGDQDVAGFLLHMHEGEGGGDEWVPLKDCWTLVTVDTALSKRESADYFVAESWAITPPIRGLRRRIIFDALRERVPAPEQTAMLWRVWRATKAAYLGIESAAAGLATVQLAIAGGLPVRPVDADRDKVARAMPLTGAYQAHQVFHLVDSPWLLAFEKELLDFPTGEHDDQVDPAAYMEQLVRETEVEQPPRPRVYGAKTLHDRRMAAEADRRSRALLEQQDPGERARQDAIEHAIDAVRRSQLVSCPAEHWPVVRRALQVQAGIWLDTQQELYARIALEEVARLERHFRDAATHADAAAQT